MLVLKTRLYFNYFTGCSGTDTQGSQESIPNFSFIQFNVDHISVVFLPSVCPAKSSWRSCLSQSANFTGSQCLAATLIKKCNVSKDVSASKSLACLLDHTAYAILNIRKLMACSNLSRKIQLIQGGMIKCKWTKLSWAEGRILRSW